MHANQKTELNRALARITGQGKDLLLDRDRHDQIRSIGNVAKLLHFSDIVVTCTNILALDDRNRYRLTLQRLEIAMKNTNRETEIDTIVEGNEKTL